MILTGSIGLCEMWYVRGALFDELEAELSRRFDTVRVEFEEAQRVVQGLGGLEAWANMARTKAVPYPEEEAEARQA